MKHIEIIKWYNSIPQDFNDIDLLIHKRKDLSCMGHNMAIKIRDYEIRYAEAYAKRKIGEAIYISESTESVGKATAKAIVHMQDMRMEEGECEGNIKGLKEVSRHIQSVIGSMITKTNYLTNLRFETKKHD